MSGLAGSETPYRKGPPEGQGPGPGDLEALQTDPKRPPRSRRPVALLFGAFVLIAAGAYFSPTKNGAVDIMLLGFPVVGVFLMHGAWQAAFFLWSPPEVGRRRSRAPLLLVAEDREDRRLVRFRGRVVQSEQGTFLSPVTLRNAVWCRVLWYVAEADRGEWVALDQIAQRDFYLEDDAGTRVRVVPRGADVRWTSGDSMGESDGRTRHRWAVASLEGMSERVRSYLRDRLTDVNVGRAAEFAVQSGEVLEVSGVVQRRPPAGHSNDRSYEAVFEASPRPGETLRLSFERSPRDDRLSSAFVFLVGFAVCVVWLGIVLGVI